MALLFHLAGINNQNFLMKDEQTGTYWQQITGLAVSGPLAGHRLTLVPADELSFGLWKSEEPNGTVLQDAPGYGKDYASQDWDVKMARAPVVISYAQAGIKPRDLRLGLQTSVGAKAFPYTVILQQKLVQDFVGSEPVLLVVGPDNRSVRVFRRTLKGSTAAAQFYLIHERQALLMDAETGSRWNFQGCAVEGKARGGCMEELSVIKDYWFDWRNYHPGTTVYGVRRPIF